MQDKVAQSIINLDENTLIYCGRKYDVERFAGFLLRNPEYNSLLLKKR